MVIRRGFILKPTERTKVPLKSCTKIFKIVLHLRKWHIFVFLYFCRKISGNLNVLIAFTGNKFSEKQKPFRKTGVPFFS